MTPLKPHTHFNHSKLCNFIGPQKMVKNTIKLSGKFFIHKINIDMQKKPGLKDFSYICGYGITYAKFLPLRKLIKTL